MTDDAMGESWVDRQGDVWHLGADGLMHTKETRPFPREHVERKWGPLRRVADPVGVVGAAAGRDALATERLAGISDRQVRNLGHVMEREQANWRFASEWATDERDVAAEAAIEWIKDFLRAEDPASFRKDPRSFAEYKAARAAVSAPTGGGAL